MVLNMENSVYEVPAAKLGTDPEEQARFIASLAINMITSGVSDKEAVSKAKSVLDAARSLVGADASHNNFYGTHFGVEGVGPPTLPVLDGYEKVPIGQEMRSGDLTQALVDSGRGIGLEWYPICDAWIGSKVLHDCAALCVIRKVKKGKKS